METLPAAVIAVVGVVASIDCADVRGKAEYVALEVVKSLNVVVVARNSEDDEMDKDWNVWREEGREENLTNGEKRAAEEEGKWPVACLGNGLVERKWKSYHSVSIEKHENS